MEINVKKDGAIAVVDFTGELIASNADLLKTEIAKLLGEKTVYVLLMMNRISFMDSAGLGACMEINRLLSANGGMLVCASPSKQVGNIFRFTKADRKITVIDSASGALRVLKEHINAMPGKEAVNGN